MTIMTSSDLVILLLALMWLAIAVAAAVMAWMKEPYQPDEHEQALADIAALKAEVREIKNHLDDLETSRSR